MSDLRYTAKPAAHTEIPRPKRARVSGRSATPSR